MPSHDAKVMCDVLQVQLGLLGPFSARHYNSSCYKLSCALFSVFGNRIISRGLCPLHLPDLNPCVSHFWGILQKKQYGNNPGHEYNQQESIFSVTSRILMSNESVCQTCVYRPNETLYSVLFNCGEQKPNINCNTIH